MCVTYIYFFFVADRVYSLFNGYIFSNGTSLKFRISSYQEPQAEGPILEVRNLPIHIDHNTLYDIFRPYGPLSICKPITEDGAHRGKALVQFFYKYDSDSSVSDLVSLQHQKKKKGILLTCIYST